MAHIVQAVGGGNDVVLVGLQDVAMHIALEGAGDADALAVDIKTGIGAQLLQIKPIGAAFRYRQRAGPGSLAVRGKRIAARAGEVDGAVDTRASWSGIGQSGLTIMTQQLGGY